MHICINIKLHVLVDIVYVYVSVTFFSVNVHPFKLLIIYPPPPIELNPQSTTVFHIESRIRLSTFSPLVAWQNKL